MIDETYRNSFKEIYDILQNTEDELVSKIPINFIDFIKSNMNSNYKTTINLYIDIDKQPLSQQTTALLALIYRSYWATNTEKQEFAIKDKNEFIEKEKRKKEEYKGKDIYNIFAETDNINVNKTSVNNDLVVIKEKNFIKKLFNKILSIFKK